MCLRLVRNFERRTTFPRSLETNKWLQIAEKDQILPFYTISVFVWHQEINVSLIFAYEAAGEGGGGGAFRHAPNPFREELTAGGVHGANYAQLCSGDFPHTSSIN